VFTLNGLQPRRDFNRCMDGPAARVFFASTTVSLHV